MSAATSPKGGVTFHGILGYRFAMNVTHSALVVDDERDIRELLVLTLGRMGLRCDTASSLADARSLLRQNRYALCLTDMRLADGSGVDLVREIASSIRKPRWR